MSPFESLIHDFAASTGLPLEIDAQDACTLETDGLFVTIQYRRDRDDVALFSSVSDPGAALPPETLRTALGLACNGAGTRGNFLGLFDGALLLSTFLPMEGLTAESLAPRILAFADAAVAVREALAAPAHAAEAAEPPPPPGLGSDLSTLRV